MSNFNKPCHNIRKTLMLSALLAAFSVATITPISGMAQTYESPQAANNPADWYNVQGVVVKDSSGQCVRSGEWTPASVSPECNPQKVAVVTPEPVVVQAPAPAPVVVAAVPRTETRKITFGSEELFDFDKAVLKPAGKAKLDNLASELNGVDNEKIIVTGHADRIGNKQYNQKLSERRAEAVNTYLVSKGVPDSITTSRGVGETQPITQLGDCKGRISKKLIACLQPDRRVEVEVTGSKQVAMTEGTGEYVADSVITSKVKAEIFEEPSLKSREISVKTFQGSVQLSGFVSSQDEIKKAADVTSNVKGVTSIQNDLQVK